MASIEEKVEEHYKKILDELGIRHYGKTESINRTITDALRSADSKSGGSGNNYPDIQLLLENKTARRIPVMIEAKGLKNRLEKISKSGQIELITYYEKDSKRKDGTIQHHAGDANYSSIMNYAVNGAVHYANAILDSRGYTEVIAIGINGTQMNADGSVQDAECRAYYISEKNNRVPKHIPELDKEWSLLKADNLDRFFAMLDKMTLTEKELEDLRQRTETALETKIKSIHQSLYDDPKLRTALTTNEKLYLFCGLIMVGLTTKGVAPLDVNQFTGNDDQEDNDSTIIITRIRSFLKKKKCGDDKIRMILDLLQPVFKKETLWRPVNGESIYKTTGDFIQGLGTPIVNSTGGEWMVIGLARSGRTVPAGYYDNVVEYVKAKADANERLHRAKVTDNARVILALTAIGKDVTNVGGHNLLKGLDNMAYVQTQGINGPIFTLIALDSHNYPTMGDVTREKLIQVILDAQLPDGGWNLSGENADPDMTAMAIQALAPYYKTNETVKAAVDKALEALSALQRTDGGFGSWGTVNSESCAQVIVALTALGIDPIADSRFVKNGLTVLDALASFYVTGGGFRHTAGGDLDGMATEQGYYALAAYYRFVNAQTRLYDMTDVTIQTGGSNTPATGDTGVLVWIIALPVAALAAAFVLKRKEREA